MDVVLRAQVSSELAMFSVWNTDDHQQTAPSRQKWQVCTSDGIMKKTKTKIKNRNKNHDTEINMNNGN